MATSALSEIEDEFARLSPEAQLGLLERLVHHVRLGVAGRQEAWEAELSAMAADQEVQRELREISAEFNATEADGLERH
ncbi:MAG: DUF2201 family putative metallopeptidase [Limisphaerales bacterium]